MTDSPFYQVQTSVDDVFLILAGMAFAMAVSLDWSGKALLNLCVETKHLELKIDASGRPDVGDYRASSPYPLVAGEPLFRECHASVSGQVRLPTGDEDANLRESGSWTSLSETLLRLPGQSRLMTGDTIWYQAQSHNSRAEAVGSLTCDSLF